MVLGIYGASGLGAEYEGKARIINNASYRWENMVFVDDDESKAGGFLREREIMTYQQAIDRFGKEGIEFVIAIGEPAVKDIVFTKLENDNCNITSLIHPNCMPTIWSDKKIGKGLVLSVNGYFPPGCVYGNNVLIQGQSALGHDLVLGDNVVISALVFIGGNVTIGRNTYIAPCACIRNGLHIGENAIVGMGAVVTKDVPDNAVVVGNPAKIMRYNDKGRVFSK